MANSGNELLSFNYFVFGFISRNEAKLIFRNAFDIHTYILVYRISILHFKKIYNTNRLLNI
jgi:hypothetical protein